MCGIAGLYAFSGRLDPAASELLDAMTEVLGHRGPDGAGTWVSAENGIGLGNRRLAIVERTAAGAQPMSNEDGSIRVTFNGEIYNHQSLRAELEARGHAFRSRADTEAIVHAYEEWGLDCFSRLIGMWGLALWDASRKRLVLSRDRLGIKPLYYVSGDGRIAFASEIKALFVDPRLRPELDAEALSLSLTYLVTPAPGTLVRGVQKLPPGHLLVAGPGQEVQLRAFWDPLDADSEVARRAAALEHDELERFAVETIRKLLRTSVQRRMMADVPVGLFLSGGIDSSAVAALMREHATGPLHAFSIGYDEPGYLSELPHSRRVARLLECEYHEVVLTEQDMLDSIDAVLYHLDEPNGDWMSFPLYYLAREARRAGTPVVLTGEGSDETFGGYAGYFRAMRMARIADSPLWLAPGAALAPLILGPLFDLAERLLGRGQGLRDDLERIARREPAFIGLQIGVTERLKRRVLSGGDGRTLVAGRPSAVVVHHIARGLAQRRLAREAGPPRQTDGLDRLGWISYLDLKQRLPEALLARLDKMTMAHGVEARVPFLDHELVEFVTALPGSLRVRGGVAKYLLRRAAEAWLPPDVAHRPKVPFGAPVSRWLRRRLGQRVESDLEESGLVAEGIVDRGVLRSLLSAHRAGKADHAQAIWSLYTACRWYDVVLRRWARGHP
jgi:asparagine synthase (glutamine-hydrolysing)